LVAAEQVVAELPPALRRQWSGVVAAWRDRVAELLVAASGAVAEGLRPVRAADEFSEAFRAQKEQVTQAASVARELAQAVQLVFGSVGQVSDAARGAAERADAGIQRVDEALRSLADVARSVAELQRRIEELSQAVHPITQVLGTIASIAKQTNLLALNAAIEAARAGEVGKGFAVVANEVKGLAAETARATEQITREIAAMQAATEDTGRAVAEIIGVVRRIDGIASAIAAAMEQQAAAIGEIGRAIEAAADGTAESSAAIAPVSGVAAENDRLADRTRESAQVLSETTAMLSNRLGSFLATLRAA